MKICLLHVWNGYTYKSMILFSQKYQGTSIQVLIAFNGIVFLLVKL